MEKQLQEVIDSGIIALTVMGFVTPEQEAELKLLSEHFPEIKQAIEAFENLMEMQLFDQAIAPDIMIKPMLMARIDYQERLKKGEELGLPPMLTADTSVIRYAPWLRHPALCKPATTDDIQAKIIGATAGYMMAVVWIKHGTPEETHTHELESFLIVEGTCIITIGEERHLLTPGDYLSIPLHVPHKVIVTSSLTCKAILQRKAA